MNALILLRKKAAGLSASDVGILLGVLLALLVAAPWIMPALAADLPCRAPTAPLSGESDGRLRYGAIAHSPAPGADGMRASLITNAAKPGPRTFRTTAMPWRTHRPIAA